MATTSFRQEPVARAHVIAKQILRFVVKLQDLAIRFERDSSIGGAIQIRDEYVHPLVMLLGDFENLGDPDAVLRPFIRAALLLKLDVSRRRFRNIEASSVHGLTIQICCFFGRLWERAFALKQGDQVPEGALSADFVELCKTMNQTVKFFCRTLELPEHIPDFRDLVKVENPVEVGLRWFMKDCYVCLNEWNPTPLVADLEAEFYTANESIPGIGQQQPVPSLDDGQSYGQDWHLSVCELIGQLRNFGGIWVSDARLLAKVLDRVRPGTEESFAKEDSDDMRDVLDGIENVLAGILNRSWADLSQTNQKALRASLDQAHKKTCIWRQAISGELEIHDRTVQAMSELFPDLLYPGLPLADENTAFRHLATGQAVRDGADGPTMEGYFFVGGKPYQFANLQWRLLKALWRMGSTSIDVIADGVYPGEDQIEGRLRKLVNDTNGKLLKFKLRFEIISPMAAHYILQVLPPVTPGVTER